jgi:hypothetical protein
LRLVIRVLGSVGHGKLQNRAIRLLGSIGQGKLQNKAGKGRAGFVF